MLFVICRAGRAGRASISLYKPSQLLISNLSSRSHIIIIIKIIPMDSITSNESGWMLALSVAAKCGGGVCADGRRVLALAGISLLLLISTALLHWACPGGPAWGKLYLWMSRDGRIPGPRGLPFVGSMGLMTGLAHRKLARAAEDFRATRLMAMSLGSTRVVVTSDADVAKEILNSSAFADRPVKESAYGLMFHRAIGFAPYGAYWRALRRIAANHMFCPRQITASEPHRARIASQMVGAFRAAGAGQVLGVRVRDVIKRASLHNVMWSVFGKEYAIDGGVSEEVEELRGLVEEGYHLLGKLNWSDHLPLFKFAGWDPQGIRFSCSRLVPRVNRFVTNIIEEHRIQNTNKPGADFVDVLLSLQGSDSLSDSDMVAVLWEMIFRGTDTVAVLIEWTLARLALHQDVQAKVHEELDRVVGGSRAITESDSPSLVYLQAVLKETLRVHPPGPLLSWARLTTEDVHVDGKLVPAGTTAMVNMWAITHDPRMWEDPLEFRPERFLGPNGSEFSVFGSDLRLAPFGSGRRSCPGKALAMATVNFWVATLLNEYTWVPSTNVNLSEVLRLSCEMAEPLTVKLFARQKIIKM